jgi:molybdenum cofactor synthesis domain-containing protein
MVSQEPTAALVIIGAEVLSGKVDDANGPFLIGALRQLGVAVTEIRVIGDAVDAIGDALRALSPRVDHVLTTGGIGPTHDDVTIAGVAAAFGRRVIQHPELLRLLQERHPQGINEARLKMTEVPEGAEVEIGEGGFVPIVYIANVAVLPGVPSLMRACFAQVAPRIHRGPPFVSRALFLNTSESDIAGSLTVAQNAFPEVAIGSYPRFDTTEYRVKVTLDGRDPARVEACHQALRGLLRPAWIISEE